MLILEKVNENCWQIFDDTYAEPDDSPEDKEVVGGIYRENGQVLFYPAQNGRGDDCFNIDELQEISRWMDEMSQAKSELAALGLK
jgi:hypothetical protein